MSKISVTLRGILPSNIIARVSSIHAAAIQNSSEKPVKNMQDHQEGLENLNTKTDGNAGRLNPRIINKQSRPSYISIEDSKDCPKAEL